FNTREDFSIAEIMHQGSLNQDQCDRLIKLVRSCIDRPGKFTLSSYADLERAWGRANHTLTTFERTTISVPYKNEPEPQKFEVHAHPLWDWLSD
ncbi:hypothetical protein OF83DRAFT_1021212, partial [Amylostereum chailletii]